MRVFHFFSILLLLALLLPAANALVSAAPTFDWDNVTVPAGTTFDRYQIQIATNAAFTAIVVDANTPVGDIAASQSPHRR